MAIRIPTKRGDVLILGTEQSFSIFAVGLISQDGQQHFHGQANVKHVTGRAAAVAAANALLTPGGRIFFQDIDTGEWSEIAS